MNMWKYTGLLVLLIACAKCAILPDTGLAGPMGAMGPRPMGPGAMPPNSGVCRSEFDKEFRKCMKDHGDLKLEEVFSLVTQGASGPLPAGLDPDKTKQTVCNKRPELVDCINAVPRLFSNRCPPEEQRLMLGSVQSISQGLSRLCGAAEDAMPPCLKDYDTAFRACLTKAGINTDHFFSLLANTADGTGMTFDELKTATCVVSQERTIVQCTSTAMQSLAPECTDIERVQVGGQVQQMMVSLRDICSVCLSEFQHSFEQCFSHHDNLEVKDVFGVISSLSGAPTPPGLNAADVKQKLCKSRGHIVKCLHDVYRNTDSNCDPRDNAFITNTINSNVQGTAAVCDVEPEMPPCLQIFDDNYRECLSGIPLNPDDFFAVIHRQADNKTAQTVCDKTHNGKVLQCSEHGLEQMKNPKNKCAQREINQVETSVKRTLTTYEAVCLTSSMSGGLAQILKSGCIQEFTGHFQQCLNTRAHVGLEMIMGLMSKGPAALLMPTGNKEQILPRVCMNQQAINACVKEVKEKTDKRCTDSDKMMVKTTINLAESLVTKNCEDFKPPEIPMPACLKKFDTSFRQCMKAKKINPDHFFKVLANQTIDGLTAKELRKKMCSNNVNPEIIQCAMSSMNTAMECSEPEKKMVQGTVKQSIAQFEGICLSATLPGGLSQLMSSQCIQQFSTEFKTCLVDQGGVGLDGILSLLMDITDHTMIKTPRKHSTLALLSDLCGKRDKIDSCVIHIHENIKTHCAASEQHMVRETVDMVDRLMTHACSDDLSSAKEELRSNCDKERKEFENRLSSLQQQHKMLKTQHDDIQAEYSKLNLDCQKEKEDQKQVESQRNQEYMQLKQEKELEITSLKDQLANIGREKQQLSDEINTLKTQLQNAQQQYQAQLQAQQAQLVQNQPAQGQVNLQQGQGNLPQQAQGQPNAPLVQGGAVNAQAPQGNAQIPLNNQAAAVQQNQVQEMNQGQQAGQQQANQVNPAEQAKLLDENQQQHQVQPPNLDADAAKKEVNQ